MCFCIEHLKWSAFLYVNEHVIAASQHLHEKLIKHKTNKTALKHDSPPPLVTSSLQQIHQFFAWPPVLCLLWCAPVQITSLINKRIVT